MGKVWKLLLAMALLGSAPVYAQSTLEQCAALEDSDHRLVCYDGLHRTKTASTVKGDWIVREETSRIDDSRSVFLSTRATTSYRSDYTEHWPVLTLRCMENTTALIVHFDGDYMSDSRYWGPMTMRVDERPATDHDVTSSTDNKALGLWRGGQSIPVIQSLLGGERLIIRATPVSSSAVTVEFNIAGLEDEIGPLRETCGW